MNNEILFREYYLINSISLGFNSMKGIYLVDDYDTILLFNLKTINEYIFKYYIYKICKNILDRIKYYKLKDINENLNTYVLNLKWLKIIINNYTGFNTYEIYISFYSRKYNYEYTYINSLVILNNLFKPYFKTCLSILENNINLIIEHLKDK